MQDRPTNLPLPASQFVGREELLGELGRRVRGGTRLLTLVGTGGAGKTRLAVEFGHRYLPFSPGGVWFCDLMDVATEAQLQLAVTSSLNASAEGMLSTAQLAEALSERGEALYILDNFEQIPQLAAPCLKVWMAAARRATFLVTSRRPLLIAGEEVLSVAPLPVPDPDLPLAELERVPSVALFVSRASAVQPDFRLNAENAEAVASLVRELDGLPLAIELAAARARVLSPAGMLQRLGDRFALLAVGRRGPSQRKASLRGALEASWRLLAPWERAALTQLSVFRGGWTANAAEEVLDLSPWVDAPRTLDVVQGLVDHGLVYVRPRPSGARFGMYTHIAEFAAMQLGDGLDGEGAHLASQSPRSAEVVLRHAEHFARLATSTLDEIRLRRVMNEPHARLRDEQENLQAACRVACREMRGPDAAVLAFSLLISADDSEARQLAVELGREALALPDLSTGLRVDLHLGVADQEGRLGRPRESLRHAELADELADHSPRWQVRALRLQADALSALGRDAEAELRLEQASALVQHAEDPVGEAHTLGSLAGLAFLRGQLESAEALAMRALNAFRRLRDVPNEGTMLSNLADIATARGNWVEADRRYQAALVVSRTTGLHGLEGHVLANLCSLAVTRGQLAEAESLGSRALDLLRAAGNRRMELYCLVNLADAELQLGRTVEARSRAASVLDADPREAPLRAAALAIHAEARATINPHEDVDQELGEAEALLEQLGDWAGRAGIVLRRARIRRLQGDAEGLASVLAHYDALAQSLPQTAAASLRPQRDALAPFDDA